MAWAKAKPMPMQSQNLTRSHGLGQAKLRPGWGQGVWPWPGKGEAKASKSQAKAKPAHHYQWAWVWLVKASWCVAVLRLLRLLVDGRPRWSWVKSEWIIMWCYSHRRVTCSEGLLYSHQPWCPLPPTLRWFYAGLWSMLLRCIRKMTRC